MLKVFLISVVIVSCSAASLQVPAVVEAPAGLQKEVAEAQPVGQYQVLGYQQVPSPFVNHPIHHYRTQEVLPVRNLAQGEVLNYKADAAPVLIRFQSESGPVQIETSHIPSPPGEVSVTQHQDEPHRVIHEVIRPVIQEIREIIQPYRRITQEIRPVQEQVHTDVSADDRSAVAKVAPVAAPVAVTAPVSAVVSAPAPTLVRAAPTLVSAPIQAVQGIQGYQGYYGYGSPYQYAYANPVQTLSRSNLGVIARPQSLYTHGSYIQAFIDQLGARRGVEGSLLVSQPNYLIQRQPVVESVAVEPVASDAVAVAPAVVATPKVAVNRAAQFTQRHVEYNRV